MKKYLDIVDKIINEGVDKGDRTGTGTMSIAGCMFEHDMSEGFPLLTTKRMPFRIIATELEFFIHGLTDKKWLQSRGCHIWDEWCSPDKVKYGHGEDTKKEMMEERELGPIYGWQWRNFGGRYKDCQSLPIQGGVDQLMDLVVTIKHNPDDRRMLVVAWSPLDNHRMALPPCHWAFQVTISDGKLNLMWNQRSVDVALGLPFNIASYALLLHLLAKETGYAEGRLIGFLGDTHIYSNHIEKLRDIQLVREPLELCKIDTKRWRSIFDWKAEDTDVFDYKYHKGISFDIAV